MSGRQMARRGRRKARGFIMIYERDDERAPGTQRREDIYLMHGVK